ncbi:PEP/pyruvate-binding domain-containing protein [Thermoactinospora rubra]|uniref:PEP/pyruvate-binding domain-containing protein n=1 Tax=Thermoactinospora rubra TaxID=1088767 RepID=UPI000A113390|nr:PEP/pyruvate-binding domain-containing protein [Thermoactinospora rubra]
MTPPLVLPLGAVQAADLALAGGKGANLGELLRAGFPVPDGFVVTTHAYAAAVRGATGREAVEAAQLPAELREAILDAYAALGAGPVAVRSSATAEDLPGAAFAGQQETYLNVVGEEAVLRAVRRCWGSLWGERAVAYRARLGIDPADVRIAVVVQVMVPAEAAGVLFTANPVTGERAELVVDAGSGLGEAVVSGLVTPDHYVLDRDGAVRDWSPGRREVVITSAPGGGVGREEGRATGEPLLGEATLKELARLGTAVAGHFGRPQDIEWALAGEKVVLVQARPMTALPPPPVKLNAIQRRLGSVLLEYLPVRPYPIDMSTWVPHGPMGMMASITRGLGLRGLFEGALEEVDGVVYRLVPQPPRPTPRVLAAPFILLWRARRHRLERWQQDPRFVGFLRDLRELERLDLTALPWERLVGVPRRALRLVEPITGLRADYLPGAGLALARLLLTLRLLRRTGLMADLVMGAETRTQAANRALEELAERVRRGEDVEDRLPAFLAEFGNRETVSPVLITPPTWADSPRTVRDLIAVLASRPPAPPAEDLAEAAMKRLLDRRGLRQRRLLERLVARARLGVAFREDTHFWFTKPMPILRRALLEIGRRLLERPEDVFHLRLEELEGIADPEGPEVARLRGLALARAARREELSGVRLIDPRAVFPADDRHADALVSGAPAGGGTATGPVKVVRDPSEFGRLAPGDVLVCPYTNPSWTPLFQRAAAVVVDTGGIASHAAIVAREYGLPAVMGTVTGTTVLTDGQIVTVDGDSGRVVAAAQDLRHA